MSIPRLQVTACPKRTNLLQTKQIGHCIPVVLFLLVHDMQQYF